ncbi:hypothetical protein HZA73_09760 [candidate division TA06 bacterium]|nr:hypothetical protein [candidate division TA06 bacterium]
MKILKITFLTVVLTITAFIIIRQPWQKNVMVLSQPLLQNNQTIELWEKPYHNIFSMEYTTWFVFNNNGNRTWHLIDDKYISFGTVSLFVSNNNDTIRVETTGAATPLHLIAQYSLSDKNFVARSEETVSNKAGWKLLRSLKIR